jgi:hypothetical protein
MSAASLLLALVSVSGAVLPAQKLERIKPSEADPRIHNYDEPNLILRPAAMDSVAPLMVFMPGTNGSPMGGLAVLQTMAKQGYRAIGLEYDDSPAVIQVCPATRREDCAAKFREMRIWGTGGSPDVHNPVEESIAARLIALLDTLAKRHPTENWGAYLTDSHGLNWSRIAVSGLSQGAGMAAFIAKKESVPRVVLFSCPIDGLGTLQDIRLAPWLDWPSATPADRWYAERNAREPFNDALMVSYPKLGIPKDHTLVFNLDLPPGFDRRNPMAYHGVTIRDERYLPQWKFMIGDATSP